ncbi:MAG TPA: pirin family protein [Acidiferrobacterales bacterium]|nr:pirin family protein [Acidiferrobacterales bacterium]
MIALRKSEHRGHANHGWLDSYHTFSFADYYDPQHMEFSSLRVINEDRVAPGSGFPRHGHRDMEIISYVLEGALEHKDSMGNGSAITPGEVQRMSAGTGVMHSEYNASKTELVHFLQIWIVPDVTGIEPEYEQKRFADEEKRGRFCLVAAPDGREGSLTIHQDALLYATLLGKGEVVTHVPQRGRKVYVHVARGTARVNDDVLHAGDGVRISDEGRVALAGEDNAEVLLFDLP